MNRRDVLKSALAGAVPAAAQHTDHAKPAAAKPAAAKQTALRQQLLFDDHQLATVESLCDLIIPATDTPGAKAARVHEFIDLMLNDGPASRRNNFLSGLGWLDGFAIRRHKQPFVRCGQPDQVAMLKALDGSNQPELQPGAEFFRDVKGLTTMGYYTSREGIKELNKGKVPSGFGCKATGGREV